MEEAKGRGGAPTAPAPARTLPAWDSQVWAKPRKEQASEQLPSDSTVAPESTSLMRHHSALNNTPL